MIRATKLFFAIRKALGMSSQVFSTWGVAPHPSQRAIHCINRLPYGDYEGSPMAAKLLQNYRAHGGEREYIVSLGDENLIKLYDLHYKGLYCDYCLARKVYLKMEQTEADKAEEERLKKLEEEKEKAKEKLKMIEEEEEERKRAEQALVAAEKAKADAKKILKQVKVNSRKNK